MNASGPTYYATYNPQTLQLTRLGYVSGGNVSAQNLYASSDMPPEYMQPVLDDADRELEMFLKFLYQEGVQINTEKEFELDRYIVENQLDSHYSKLNLVDWFSLTGAKILDMTKYPPGTPRPSLTELPDGDTKNMFQIIRSLGLTGFLPHLLVPGGISISDFERELRYLVPDSKQRERFVVERAIPAMISRQSPIVGREDWERIVAE